MKKHSSKDIFVLHIDAKPAAFSKVAAVYPKISHLVPHKESNKSKVWAFLWDKVQFVLVSVFVFVVIYTILNWSALSVNLVHYWNVWKGFESPLQDLVTEKPLEPEKLPGNLAQAQRGAAVPNLNLEIYPPDMRLVIPRINQNVPVIGVKNENLVARKWDDLESDIQKSLKNGVIHYPATALPGDNGNIVITGHSSYYAWDSGQFKDVFALLHDVRVGDRVIIYFNQKKFVYEITSSKVVLPKDVDVLSPTKTEQLTLITCTPIGTNLKRLIVIGKLVEKS